MNIDQSTELIFDRDLGFVKRTTNYQVIGRADDAIASMANNVTRKVHNVCTVAGIDVSLACSHTVTSIWGSIPKLRLCCNYHEEGGRIYPRFSGECNIGRGSNEWAVPASMNLKFMVVADSRCYFENAYLIAAKLGAPGWFRLPLANVYEDGKICMGRDNSPRGSTLADLFLNSLNMFYSSSYNSDLHHLQNEAAVKALFSYDASGVQIQPPDNWEDQCSKVNSTVYSVMEYSIMEA